MLRAIDQARQGGSNGTLFSLIGRGAGEISVVEVNPNYHAFKTHFNIYFDIIAFGESLLLMLLLRSLFEACSRLLRGSKGRPTPALSSL